MRVEIPGKGENHKRELSRALGEVPVVVGGGVLLSEQQKLGLRGREAQRGPAGRAKGSGVFP